jgi:hypothetical protein
MISERQSWIQKQDSLFDGGKKAAALEKEE